MISASYGNGPLHGHAEKDWPGWELHPWPLDLIAGRVKSSPDAWQLCLLWSGNAPLLLAQERSMPYDLYYHFFASELYVRIPSKERQLPLQTFARWHWWGWATLTSTFEFSIQDSVKYGIILWLHNAAGFWKLVWQIPTNSIKCSGCWW